MSGVVIFLPSVVLSDETSLADRRREFPRLAGCLGASTRAPHTGPLEPMLAACCGLTADFALARITALYDLACPAPAPDLLRSDPVHLHADPNKVLVYGPNQLELSAAEADDLLGSLQQEFPALGWQRGTAPTRWYIQRPAEVAGIAPSAQWLSGRSITPFMPLAAPQRAWRRWLNDLQMVLHENPVNHARVRRGLPAVNGVWWFGGGEELIPGACPFTQLIGNDVLLAGLARQTGLAWQPQARPELGLAAAGDVLMVAGTAFGEATTEDLISLAEIETQWLPKLVSALRRGRLRALTFVTATHRARLSWWQSWQRWRPPQSFKVE